MLEKKRIKLSLTALAALILTACGSSGGDGDNSANSAVNKVENAAEKVEDKAKDVVNQVDAASDKYHGGSVTLNVEDGKPANATYATVSSNDYGKIKVDGKEITVLKQDQYPGISSGGWMILNNEAVCCGRGLDYVKLGYTVKDNSATAYFNGELTALDAIPKAGKVQYAKSGSAMVGLFDLDGTKEKDALTDLKFSPEITADFDNKQLTGSIYAMSNDNVSKEVIALKADIKGNQFAGTASLINLDKAELEHANVQSEADKNAQLNGAFYGPKAENVAGIAHNEKWGVVFGATKK
ncbi:Slam-dependent surface lipoprotein [Spirabiliibacterium falconis]|uniref:Slam-dependent surface lipoprotein n=1 Tax=Spirabiliibacterium falconis TaxID=572023 RepID=UPI001AAC77B7|nr:Slam-dependent surface lipoprotein [Spirabiliibacterium falconis]MBE2893608.1 transferrin-binding protein-like solute binding protein [Spirabiliibacterium falconis]